MYYFGQILLQTYEGVKFVCENPLDVVIPFTISFEELKGVICEKIDSKRARKISCILYRYPIMVFGGFFQFQTKYVTDEASMQEMFSMYIENRGQISFIELYVEFEQSKADRNILREDYNSNSEEEFESNYEVIGPDRNEDQCDGTMAPDVTEVANALANEGPFEEPSFMQVLDLEAMHIVEFPEYMSADGEFAVGMEFSSRKVVIKAIKEVSMISKKYCWVIRRYNGSHTCIRATISQDHSKLDSITIVEAIKSLVEVDPSLKVKSVIAEVQSKFNYTVSYRKAWLAKQRAVEKIFGVTELGHLHQSYIQTNLYQETFSLVALTGRMRSLKCARCQVDWSLQSTYIAFDVTVMDQVRRVYRARFRPLSNRTTWPAYNEPRFVPNPYLKRVTKGLSRMTRFLNEMDTRMLRRPRRCRLCWAKGHSRSRCHQSTGANVDRDV
ncbi:hypothetical protein Ahy_A06g026834 [Arachis hypogaea]|uniref:Transposase MuDR plant domain-containing protein n=1 Tax=Arachis hypogaea TaxID=3818 RepID=A0A445CLU3_ARAHY|nr:hypothetical protein Ahy_A06g026834 [Arachis hypogaea]